MVTEGQKLGDSKGYWRQENIQLMLNWVFRDHKNPALQRFHAIPLQVSTVIRTLFDFSNTGNHTAITQVLHNYCKHNFAALSSFMLFYVQNLDNEHWALQVAVNPMEMIRRVTTSNVPQGQDHLIHGYFYIDPMDKANRDGNIPSRKNLKDSKLRNCELIFLLNFMSRYQDMHAHNLLDNYMYQDSLEYLWAMGSIGPFGMVFLEGEMDWFNVIGKHHFELIFPQLLAPKKTFPSQSDGYNCGVFCYFDNNGFRGYTME